ncbi:MAG: hypothetical protein H7144_17515 [Burkholderiales bacterium]|nr:hypothetical protein [Phycisphaerae bacterium]
MKVSRRDIIKGAAASAAIGWTGFSAAELLAQQVAPLNVLPSLPWEREMLLREAAKKVFVNAALPVRPSAPSEGQGTGTQILSLSTRTAIWGPSHRVTLSLLKNDIWDRRITQAPFPKMKDVVDNAMAPGAKKYTRTAGEHDRKTTRPNWNMLMADGSMTDPLRGNRKALMKVTGQIILAIDELQGAPQPEIAHCCADGVATMTVAKDSGKAILEYAASMTQNVFAVRGSWSGLAQPISLRVYRNADTRNDGIEPPMSGTDGRYFWVRQKLPAEKTFPNGFEFIMLGLVDDPSATLSTTTGAGLGTPSPNAALRDAEGTAATASFVPKTSTKTTGFIAVVSTVDADGGDVMVEARKRLDAAAAGGFDGIAAENAKWYGDLYDRRENGRTFYGNTGYEASENVTDIFYSWFSKHGGGTKTDMRKYQASAHYCVPETEPQAYSGLPCYNEVFYTHKWVNGRGDAVDMWKQLVEHWMDASRKNAREVFDMPGMYITHGFLPPVKPDIYVHTNFALEFAVDTMAQILKAVWDEWDYTGDERFLRETCYPMMREMALFYAAYVTKEADGKYHIVPCMQEESWGFYAGLSRNRDCIAALCLFRWALLRTTEAGKLLGLDADQWSKWTQIADNLASYPTWPKERGVVFAGLPGVEPWRGSGEHPWDVGCYPTLLSDDINLDSDEATKEMMVRTVNELRSGGTGETLVLLGRPVNMGTGLGRPTPREHDLALGGGPSPERLLNSRSGRIHLFPCVPSSEVAFRHYQARGGLLVSACRDNSAVTYVEIEPRRDVHCQLMNPWPGKSVAIRAGGAEIPFSLDNTNGQCISFHGQKGKRYFVSRK